MKQVAFFVDTGRRAGDVDVEACRAGECAVCPLRRASGATNLSPLGAGRDGIYILSGGMTKAAADEMALFSREEQGFLTKLFNDLAENCRLNSVTRSFHNGNTLPEDAVACCRPSIERDICAIKPRVIFAFGGAAVKWFGFNSHAWTFRQFLYKQGDHVTTVVGLPAITELMRDVGVRGHGKNKDGNFLNMARACIKNFSPLPYKEVVEKEAVLYDGKYGDLDKLSAALRRITDNEDCVVAFDYETANDEVGKEFRKFRPYGKNSRILSIGVDLSGGDNFAFAVDHPQARWSSDEVAQIKGLWRDFLLSSTVRVVHNLAFEGEWTSVLFGMDTIAEEYLWHDTLSANYVLDSRQSLGARKLDSLCRAYCCIDAKAGGVDAAKILDYPLDDVLRYNARDAWATLALYYATIDREFYDPPLSDLYEQQLDRVFCALHTQARGLHVDLTVNKELGDDLEARISGAAEVIEANGDVADYRSKYGKFLPSSDAHVKRLFAGLGEHIKDSRAATLTALNRPLAKMIVEYRQLNKLRGTYITPFASTDDMLWYDGTLRPIFQCAGTATRRFSSDSPNAQNFPKRESVYVRKQFTAPKEHVILSVDYGQIEARVFAMASKDAQFVRAIREGLEVHGAWRDKIIASHPGWLERQYGGDLKKARNDVKGAWTFALFFGGGIKNTASLLGLRPEDLQPLYAEFRRTFAGVFDWQSRVVDKYTDDGYVSLLSGFRRWGALGFNQSINTPIQGTACEIVALAWRYLVDEYKSTGDKVFVPILNIHDDLTFYVPADSLDCYMDKICRLMLKPAIALPYCNVPLVVEASVGKDLGSMEEVKIMSSAEAFGANSFNERKL